jgi:aspartyl protease family protein
MLRIVTLLLIVIAAAIALYLTAGGLFQNFEAGEIAYILIGLALVGLYAASLRFEYGGRAGKATRHAIIWLVLCFALITGYAYRSEITQVASRVTGEIAPPGTALWIEGREPGEKAVRVRNQPNGSFVARGTVNGSQTRFIVDTGATTVVLKSTDAARAGIDVDGLTFSVPVQTANGTTFTAPIRLKSVMVGPIEVTDVEALVSPPGNLKENLLGMSFLKRLRSYEVSGDFLTLRN